MQPIYQPCFCGSGVKFKFCCLNKSPEDLITKAARVPIHQCLIDAEWEEHGLAVLFVSRHFFDCRFFYGVYMVDTYCLGLKNTLSRTCVDRDEAVAERRRLESGFNLVPFDYEDARSLILGAIDYAANLGFKPNEDWVDSRYIIEFDRPYEPKFEFGKDGKPFFIAGPDDNASSVLRDLKNVDHDYLVGAQLS